MEGSSIEFEVYDLVILVGAVAVPVNLYAIWILSKYPRVIGEIAVVFHKSLAMVDLLTGISCLGSAVRIFARDSTLTAMLASMSTNSFTMSSLSLLTLVTLDRFVAIRQPLRHLVIFSKARAKLYSVSLVTASSVYMVIQTWLSFGGGRSRKFDSERDSLNAVLFCVTAVLVSSAVLFLTVLNMLLFISVLRILRQSRCSGPETDSVTAPRRVRVARERNHTSAKIARMILVMTAAFYLAFTPAIVAVGVNTFLIDLPLSVLNATFVTLQCNCIINPFIYLVMNPSFRRLALKPFSRLRRCRRTRRDDAHTGSGAHADHDHSSRGSQLTAISTPKTSDSPSDRDTDATGIA